MSLETGKQLGHYKIISPAGAGGMGEVYKATDTRLDREVAIKVLHAKVANSTDIQERFEREAKVIAGLNHPSICTLFDIGNEDGIDYLVMEFTEGESLNCGHRENSVNRLFVLVSMDDGCHRVGLSVY